MTDSERTFKLVVEYDGSAYHGWQRQGSLPTIQAEIERVIAMMTRKSVHVMGSGRTDSGVHALGQVASFRCATRLSCEALVRGINSLLPGDIVIRDCVEVPASFHACHSAIGKTYRYRIHNSPFRQALGRQYAWHICRPLDIEAMQQALCRVVGTHDFKGFESTGSPRVHTVRTIYRADLSQADGCLSVELTGNGFLRCMVRNIVGTLVEIGLHRYPETHIARMLESRDRRQAGTAAPAHGLFLVRVLYETDMTERPR